MTTFTLDNIKVIQFTEALRNYYFGNAGNGAATGGANVALGTWALHSVAQGGANVAVGDFALAALTNTFGNVAVGRNALKKAITPTDTTAVGDNAGANLTTGTGGTLIGKFAFENVLSALGNTGVGDSVGRFTLNGQLNSVLGYRALEGNLNGSYNVALGAGSMLLRQAGDGNTAVGYHALGGISTLLGSNNTALGIDSGYKIQGSNNILIGARAGSGASQKTDAANSIAIGNDALTTADNQIVIGNNASQSVVLLGVSFTKDQLVSLLGNVASVSTALQLTGSPFVDALIGDASANSLDGRAGADIMRGRAGGDTYTVDDVGDQVIEAVGEGADTVLVTTAITYTLAAGSEIEFLQTVNAASTYAVNLTGNEFANIIMGNATGNTLDGGLGADVMSGNAGDDIYKVDNAGDQVLEAAGGGSDTVVVSTAITYALAAGAEIECLKTDSDTSVYAVNLTGNEFANIIMGNAADNLLNGQGGSDTLSGFGGSDTFVFATALAAANIDAISDFAAGQDFMQLSAGVFTGLAAGVLNASEFVIGAAAGDADDHVIYNNTTGGLFFDDDGTGANAAVQFATVGLGLALTHGDFMIV
jgi:Ca2+-binding RTX toxin-like protein